MSDSSRFEQRIGALVAAYADRAPIEVDPMQVTRLATAGSRQVGPISIGSMPIGRALGLALVVLAMLVSMVAGALVAGGQPFGRDPDEILTRRTPVEPFAGLPPEEALASAPEDGELVLAFGGRIIAAGHRLHRVWVYSDGRLIRVREGDGWSIGSPDPNVVLERRLSPEGVEHLRSDAWTGLHDPDPDGWHKPGVLWGGLRVRDGNHLDDVMWRDSELPTRLADPASWLPAAAWEDPRIVAYVPSRYAVCFGPLARPGATNIERARIVASLPEPTKELIHSRGARMTSPDGDTENPGCVDQVTTEDARAIAATLEDAGLSREPSLRYHTGPAGAWVELLPILPDGDVVCNCG